MKNRRNTPVTHKLSRQIERIIHDPVRLYEGKPAKLPVIKAVKLS